MNRYSVRSACGAKGKWAIYTSDDRENQQRAYSSPIWYAPLPLLTDAVDKVGDGQRTSNNRIRGPRSLNQCCAPDSYLETMLLTRPSKNVYRQHRPQADVSHALQVILIGFSWPFERILSTESHRLGVVARLVKPLGGTSVYDPESPWALTSRPVPKRCGSSQFSWSMGWSVRRDVG